LEEGDGIEKAVETVSNEQQKKFHLMNSPKTFALLALLTQLQGMKQRDPDMYQP